MPRTAPSYDSAFASDIDEQPKKASSICELSSYEKLNSGQTKGGKSDASSSDSSGASSPSSSSPSSSSDGTTAPSSIQVSNKNRLSLGGAGRHTKRLVDMKTAAAVASVHKSGSVGAKKVAAAAAAAASTAKKKRGRRSTNGSIGSAKKKSSTEKKKPAAAVAAAAAKKRKKKQSSSSSAAAKPASVAMPGRLVRISDYRRRMDPSPISSPIHRVNLTFTPEAVEAADKQKKEERQKATTTATAASKKRSATMVSGGTGRFNIKQE